MIILQLFLILIQLVVVPVLLGRLIKYDDDPVINYVIGFFMSLAIFQLLSMPMAALGISFNALCIAYIAIAGSLCLMSFIRNRRIVWWNLKEHVEGFTLFEWLYLLGFVILLLAQMYFAVFYQSGSMTGDDYEYVVTAADDVAMNRISASFIYDGEPWRVSPRTGTTGWIAYTAFLSKVSMINVAALCHTVLAVALLLIAYIVYWVVSCFLIKERENRLVFMLLLSTAIVFGLYSHNALTFRLLATLWQGKAVFTCISVPFLLVMITRIFNEDKFKEGILPMLVLTIGSSSFSLLGTGLTVALMAGLCILISIHKRKVTGLAYTLVCSIFPAIQAGMYLYIFEVVLGYNVA